jgi:HEAT repeat protein
LAASNDKLIALEAFQALAVVGDETAVGVAESYLASPVLSARKSAVTFLARFPSKGLAVARTLLASPEEGKVRTGLEILQTRPCGWPCRLSPRQCRE